MLPLWKSDGLCSFVANGSTSNKLVVMKWFGTHAEYDRGEWQ